MHRSAVLARVAAVAVVTALVAGGCGGSSTVTLRVEHTGAITWTPCGTVQCASLGVPLDAAHPRGTHITLALARRPASGRRIGVLFTNPGGPGGSGVDFLRESSNVFPREILRAFDLVSWDPRGIGHSSPLACGDDLDAFYAVDRDPTVPAQVAANVAAARGFVAACVRGSKSLLPNVSTAASARDMDAIRAAMGEERISYLGFSYGTYLGALYAEAFPGHLRAAVLDGAIDPSLSYEETTVQQAVGFERELDGFFDWCAGAADCGFAQGGDPRASYDSLQRMITAEPVPAHVAGETRTLGPGEFDIGVASALYSGDTGFARLGAALAQAARGIGDQLLKFSDEYTDRKSDGKYSTETAALYATGCIDAPVPATLADVQRLAARATRVAPHFGATTVWLGLPCTYWPVRATRPARAVRAPGAPPILVVGATADPATPYAWAQSLARQLTTGRLLTFEGDGHTSYGRGNTCIDHNVNRYLLDLTIPAPNARC